MRPGQVSGLLSSNNVTGGTIVMNKIPNFMKEYAEYLINDLNDLCDAGQISAAYKYNLIKRINKYVNAYAAGLITIRETMEEIAKYGSN